MHARAPFSSGTSEAQQGRTILPRTLCHLISVSHACGQLDIHYRCGWHDASGLTLQKMWQPTLSLSSCCMQAKSATSIATCEMNAHEQCSHVSMHSRSQPCRASPQGSCCSARSLARDHKVLVGGQQVDVRVQRARSVRHPGGGAGHSVQVDGQASPTEVAFVIRARPELVCVAMAPVPDAVSLCEERTSL